MLLVICMCSSAASLVCMGQAATIIYNKHTIIQENL